MNRNLLCPQTGHSTSPVRQRWEGCVYNSAQTPTLQGFTPRRKVELGRGSTSYPSRFKEFILILNFFSEDLQFKTSLRKSLQELWTYFNPQEVIEVLVCREDSYSHQESPGVFNYPVSSINVVVDNCETRNFLQGSVLVEESWDINILNLS